MANLMKTENREAARSAGPEYRWDPFRMMDALFRWDPFRADWSGSTGRDEFIPRFDVKDTKDAYVIKADLPGVKEEQLEVAVNGNTISISGKREEERREESDHYYAMERSTGSFTRNFAMPDTADPEGVSAELRSGVLTVQIAKKPE